MKGNSKMEEALQRITGHTVEKIREDLQRDFYLSSSEAVQYGIIDKVLLPKQKVRQELYQKQGVSRVVSFEEWGGGDKVKAHPHPLHTSYT